MMSWLVPQHNSMAIPPRSVTTEQHTLATPGLDHKKTMAKGFSLVHRSGQTSTS